ncbi:MAG: hypothetical protein ACR2G4_11250, partial [Pyrinomonadaceae bacterium]
MKDIRNKLLIITGIVLGVFAVVAGIRAVSNRAPWLETARQKSIAVTARPTASDRQILAAQDEIARAPHASSGYNLLCAAYLKKARETGDFAFNAKAEAALNRSLELTASEDNYDALKLKSALLL